MKIRVCAYDEVQDYLKFQPAHVLSIRDPGRERPTALQGRADVSDLYFHDKVAPEPGHDLPNMDHIDAILALVPYLNRGPVLVHCTMGISRSAAAAAILLAAHQPARQEAEIFEDLVRVRPIAWPSSLLIAMADERLQRGGRLVAAMEALHSRQVTAQPETAAIIARVGRADEVAAAARRATK